VADIVHAVLTMRGLNMCLLVGALVFAEAAVLIGLVLPGQAAVILGGVAASRGAVSVIALVGAVIVAAACGDSVAYQLGRLVGPRMGRSRMAVRRSAVVKRVEYVLDRWGNVAVLCGRYVGVTRSTLPAFVGAAGLPYRRFLLYNIAGVVLWTVSCVALGYFAGESYMRLAHWI